MNELEEIMNGKHEIKHLKIDYNTLIILLSEFDYKKNKKEDVIGFLQFVLEKLKENS